MSSPFLHLGPVVQSPWLDFSESLDIRLVAAGRLSQTAIDIRHDRAELARVLGQTNRPSDGAFAADPDGETR